MSVKMKFHGNIAARTRIAATVEMDPGVRWDDGNPGGFGGTLLAMYAYSPLA